MNRRHQRRAGPAPLDLIEEAVHLVRGAWPGTWLAYALGTAPFVLGLLYFWTDMSRGAFADRRCLAGALGLALLFIWMRTWQAVFAVKLREQRALLPASRWTFRRWCRVALVQAALQPTALLVVPLSTVLAPWTLAFYQNAAALADSAEGSLRGTCSRSARLAIRWRGANFLTLLTLAGFGFVVFLNIIVTLLALPALVKMLFGVESALTFSGWAVFNTTLLASAAALAYLVLDPLLRAVFVLRCYYGESQTTGEDLRVELRLLGATPRALAAALILLFLSSHLALPAAEPPVVAPVSTRQNAADLDQALDRVLKRTEYNWRQPREQSPEVASEENWVARQLRKVEASFKEALHWMRDKLQSALDWLEKVFRPRSRASPRGSGLNSLAWLTSVQTLVFVLLAAVLSVLAVLLLRAWKRRVRGAAVLAEPVTAVPDLRDENIGADQLPEDGWLRLAREMAGQGELRLAMRALYLGSLAHLAERQLVKLAKFKSNRDYEREVRRRARALPGLPEAFADNVTAFDRAWYGLHEVTGDSLARFEENFQRIKAG